MTEIAILSGKGGTGKTSFSAAFATIEQNSVVADCDVDAANLYLILKPENYREEKFTTGYKAVIDYSTCTSCGLCISYCRFDAIEYVNGKVTISVTSCDGCKLCSRVCSSNSVNMVPNDKSYWYIGNYRNGKIIHARLAPGEENSGKLIGVVRENARKTAKETGSEFIIIDGPPGTGCPVISSLTGTQKVIIVTEPSGSALHDMKRVLQLVRTFRIKPYVVINKYDVNPGFSDLITSWCNEQNILIAGKMPFLPEFVHAMIKCKSINEYLPGSQVSIEIRRIYDFVFKEN